MRTVKLLGLATAAVALAGFSIPQPASAAVIGRPSALKAYVAVLPSTHYAIRDTWWFDRDDRRWHSDRDDRRFYRDRDDHPFYYVPGWANRDRDDQRFHRDRDDRYRRDRDDRDHHDWR
jgi:hypothetical protein